MKKIIKKLLLSFADIVIVPFTYLFMPVLRKIRFYGLEWFPLNRKAFLQTGVFPIRDHYYDPQFVYSSAFDASVKRQLPFSLRDQEQLERLKSFQYTQELKNFALEGEYGAGKFYLNNPAFGRGDAELYYLMIRNLKPKRVVEIGSGFSTLIALEAIKANKKEGFETMLTCIEPFEMPWLSDLKDVTLIRKKVEEMDLSFFHELKEGDFLFIDSSHIIRPENDVLYEYLHILPSLHKGVLIHIHDIFSPRHYRQEWLVNEARLWNEQYLLEAFLSFNHSFEVFFALNYLKNDYFGSTHEILCHMDSVCEPGSFWIKKTQ